LAIGDNISFSRRICCMGSVIYLFRILRTFVFIIYSLCMIHQSQTPLFVNQRNNVNCLHPLSLLRIFSTVPV